MAPAGLIEVPSAANAAAHGLDDVVVGQAHLKDTRNELEALPGEPDKENAVDVGSLRDANRDGGSLPAVSANEDDPFDSDSDADDDEFMPRGKGDQHTGAKSSQNQFVPTRARGNGDNNVPTEAAPPAAPSEAASRERERVGEGESGRTARLIASRGT